MKNNSFVKFILTAVLLAVLLPLTAVSIAHAEEKDYRIYDADFDDKTETEGRIYGFWTPAEDKTTYNLTLYKGTSKIGTRQCSSTGRVDLSSWITCKRGGAGTYTFKVYPTKGGESLAILSDSLEVTTGMVSAINKRALQERKDAIAAMGGGWVKGPGNIWIYYLSDGTQVKSNWVEYNGRKYYLDKNGIMLTGWQAVGASYYYFEPKGNVDNPLGALWVNTTTPDGYKVGEDGARIDEKGETVEVRTTKTLSVLSVSLNEAQEPGKCTRITDIKCGSGVVSDIIYKTDQETWTTDTVGTVNFKITINSGYLLTKGFKVRCSRAESATVLSYTASEVYVELRYRPKYVLITPGNFYINDSYILYWDKVDRAREYTVKLTVTTEETDDEGEIKTKNTTQTLKAATNCVDLSAHDVNEETVVKEITVTAGGSDTKRYIVSSAGKITDFEDLKTNRRLNGTFEINAVGLRYKDEEGNLVTGWKELLGNWYYFKKTGYASTGWFRDTNTDYWYCFDSQGRMQTGTQTLSDGVTYTFNDGTRTDLPLGAWIR